MVTLYQNIFWKQPWDLLVPYWSSLLFIDLNLRMMLSMFSYQPNLCSEITKYFYNPDQSVKSDEVPPVQLRGNPRSFQ